MAKLESAIAVLLLISLPLYASAFSGLYYEGQGDDEYVQMLDTARRAWAPDVVYQTVPMLYRYSILIAPFYPFSCYAILFSSISFSLQSSRLLLPDLHFFFFLSSICDPFLWKSLCHAREKIYLLDTPSSLSPTLPPVRKRSLGWFTRRANLGRMVDPE